MSSSSSSYYGSSNKEFICCSPHKVKIDCYYQYIFFELTEIDNEVDLHIRNKKGINLIFSGMTDSNGWFKLDISSLPKGFWSYVNSPLTITSYLHDDDLRTRVLFETIDYIYEVIELTIVQSFVVNYTPQESGSINQIKYYCCGDVSKCIEKINCSKPEIPLPIVSPYPQPPQFPPPPPPPPPSPPMVINDPCYAGISAGVISILPIVAPNPFIASNFDTFLEMRFNSAVCNCCKTGPTFNTILIEGSFGTGNSINPVSITQEGSPLVIVRTDVVGIWYAAICFQRESYFVIQFYGTTGASLTKFYFNIFCDGLQVVQDINLEFNPPILF